MKQMLRVLLPALILGCLLGACKKEMYDAETAKKIMDLSFHSDTVDQYHDWSLIEDRWAQVTANVAGVKRIELLSGNPYTDIRAEVVASSDASEGEVVNMVGSLPLTADSMYVAAIDTFGLYHVVAMGPEQIKVDFTVLNTTNGGMLKSTRQQEVYYCYCSSYPQPSETWGFNDCVMRISKELRNSRTLRITVNLLAVGTTSQVAAALRLDGITPGQIQQVDIVGGSNFQRNENLPRSIIRDDNVLMTGQDRSAVINLFDDAHAAIYPRTNSQGMIYRYRYNVMHSTTNEYYEFTQPAVSYDITFKDEGVANAITFTALDPFILVNYAGTIWEVHKYRYKFNETIYSYYSNNPRAYNNGYAWALEIPYSWFRYPLAGNAMGSYKKGALYGAYQTFGHSFGEWGANRTMSRDWYLYPSTMMVY